MAKNSWIAPATPCDVDWARLASFIDGEGCIQITTIKRKKCEAKIVIANNDPRLMVWLKNTFNCGSVSVRTYTNPGENRRYKHRKTAYSWTVVARTVQWLLEGCFPFFVCKREQATICLELRKTVGPYSYSGRKRIPLSVLELRSSLKSQLSEEKQKIIPMEVSNG